MWPIQRGTTVVAKFLWILISLRVRTDSSALIDVVAPMRLPSNTCSLSGDLLQLAKLLGRGKENVNFCLFFKLNFNRCCCTNGFFKLRICYIL